MLTHQRRGWTVSSVLLLFCAVAALHAQTSARIVQPIDNASVTKLAHTTHPLASPANDRGRVPGSTSMARMMLVLKPTPAQSAALAKLIQDEHNPSSPKYHQWLTPDEFGAQFGPAAADVAQIGSWLQKQGFQVESISRGKQWIEFSGSAAQVENAFHTQMHSYQVNGKQHVANATDISIPTALMPVVNGVLSLNNFESRPAHSGLGFATKNTSGAGYKSVPFSSLPQGEQDKFKGAATFQNPDNTLLYLLAPGDFAKIYNSASLISSGTNGSGVSIAIVGRTNIQLSDVQTFRQIFGLPANDPQFIYNGADPGVIDINDEVEADLDVQWSGAVAPNATVNFVISGSTLATDGVDLSQAYIVDNRLAPIMSSSFLQCEAFLGQSGNAFEWALNEQAAAEGITAFVAAGDGGSAGCDDFDLPQPAIYGLAVSGLASTPYNVAVGGSMFNENGNNSTYWSATNSADLTSALGYIPEDVWNESCDPTVNPNCQAYSIVAGSGGQSSCLNGTVTVNPDGTYNIDCSQTTGYPKPNFQVGVGVPQDKVRDLPDISLSAAAHDGYIICLEGTCSDDQGNVSIAVYVSGTSASSPAMAGVMGLNEQKNGTYVGLANYWFYQLAATETDLASCNSSHLTDPTKPNSCIFQDVTTGTNAVPCLGGTPNCSVSDPTLTGVLTGWNAGTGYDLATGLGTVNIGNLVAAWSSAKQLATATTLAATGSTTITHGQPLGVTVSVAPSDSSQAGTPTGDFSMISDSGASAFGGTLTNGAFAGNVTLLAGGSYNVHAHYQGDGMFAPSDSTSIPVTVNPESSSVSLSAYTVDQFGNLTPITGSIPYGSFIYGSIAVAGASGVGYPSGSVTLTLDGATLGTFPLNNQGTYEAELDTYVNPPLKPGNHTIAVSYGGDASFKSSSSTKSLAVTQGSAYLEISPYYFTITQGSSDTIQITVGNNGNGAGASPTGNIQLYDGGGPLGGVLKLQPQSGGYSYASYTATGLSVGTHTINGRYSGDTIYPAVNPGSVNEYPGTIQVTAATGAANTVTVTFNPTAPTLGGKATVTVTVATAKKGGATPTGTVSLYGLSLTNGTEPLTNGTATFAATFPSAGNYFVSAQYSGDANYSGSQSPVTTLNVAQLSPVLSITTPAPLVLLGTQTSVTVTSTSAVTGIYGPTGNVQLWDSINGAPAVPLGSPHPFTTTNYFNPVTSIVTFPVMLLAGSNVITAAYQGDSNWLAATSGPVTAVANSPDFVITPANPNLTVTAGNTGTLQINTLGVLGYTSPIGFSCSNVPEGSTCTFSAASVNPGQSVTLSLATTGPSSTVVTSSLSRKVWWAVSGGSSLAFALILGLPGRRRRMKLLVVLMAASLTSFGAGCGSSSKPASPALSVGSSAVKSPVGQSFNLTASLNQAKTPTGSVTFFDGGTQIGEATLSISGFALLSVNSLSIGTHEITASYSGDVNNAAVATKNPFNQVITGTATITVTAAPVSGTAPNNPGIAHSFNLPVTLQ
jgi:hypothetical protein